MCITVIAIPAASFKFKQRNVRLLDNALEGWWISRTKGLSQQPFGIAHTHTDIPTWVKKAEEQS